MLQNFISLSSISKMTTVIIPCSFTFVFCFEYVTSSCQNDSLSSLFQFLRGASWIYIPCRPAAAVTCLTRIIIFKNTSSDACSLSTWKDNSALHPVAHTARPVEIGKSVSTTWSVPVLSLQADRSEVSRPEVWLKLNESKWPTTPRTTRRGTLLLRSTTMGSLAARQCSSASWWNSAAVRESPR